MASESLLKLALLLLLASHITCKKWDTSIESKRMVVYDAVIRNDAELAELDFSNLDEVEFQDMRVETFTVAMQSRMKTVRRLNILLGNVSSVQVGSHFVDVYIDSSKTENVAIFSGHTYKTEKFAVVNNELKLIPENLSVMTKLRSLRLQNNLIETVEMADLNGLNLLEEIRLGSNKIMHINLFQAVLPQLLSIELQKNQIRNIKIDDLAAPLLQKLNLQNNQIETVNMSQFNSFKNLADLHLTSNNIKEVTSNSLALPKLETFTIGGNQLNAIDFANWKTPKLKAISVEKNHLNKVQALTSSFPALREVKLFPNPFNCKWLDATLKALEARRVSVADDDDSEMPLCDEAATLEVDIAKLRKDTVTQQDNVQKLQSGIDGLKQIYAEGLRRIEQLKGK